MKRQFCCKCGKEIREIGFYQEETDNFICGDCYFAPEPERRRKNKKPKLKISAQKLVFIISLIMVLVCIWATVNAGGKLTKASINLQENEITSNTYIDSNCCFRYNMTVNLEV